METETVRNQLTHADSTANTGSFKEGSKKKDTAEGSSSQDIQANCTLQDTLKALGHLNETLLYIDANLLE